MTRARLTIVSVTVDGHDAIDVSTNISGAISSAISSAIYAAHHAGDTSQEETSMALQLKMRLTRKTAQLLGERQVSYGLNAVSGDENKPWSKFTPSGCLDFTVTNPEAPELEEGEYLVTLTKA